MCKDMVNTRKERLAAEGTATVTFLGAEGQEMSIECPKVMAATAEPHGHPGDTVLVLTVQLSVAAQPVKAHSWSQTCPAVACRTRIS